MLIALLQYNGQFTTAYDPVQISLMVQSTMFYIGFAITVFVFIAVFVCIAVFACITVFVYIAVIVCIAVFTTNSVFVSIAVQSLVSWQQRCPCGSE